MKDLQIPIRRERYKILHAMTNVSKYMQRFIPIINDIKS